jgi:hypothetical protein
MIENGVPILSVRARILTDRLVICRDFYGAIAHYPLVRIKGLSVAFLKYQSNSDQDPGRNLDASWYCGTDAS